MNSTNLNVFYNLLKNSWHHSIDYDVLGIAGDYLEQLEEINKLALIKYLIKERKSPYYFFNPYKNTDHFCWKLYIRLHTRSDRLPLGFFREIFNDNTHITETSFPKLIWKSLCLYDLNLQLKEYGQEIS